MSQEYVSLIISLWDFSFFCVSLDQKFLILSRSASLYFISKSSGLFSKFIIFPKGEHVSLRAPRLVVTTSHPAARA